MKFQDVLFDTANVYVKIFFGKPSLPVLYLRFSLATRITLVSRVFTILEKAGVSVSLSTQHRLIRTSFVGPRVSCLVRKFRLSIDWLILNITAARMKI